MTERSDFTRYAIFNCQCSRPEKQRQFSSPATPQFEQSSAGYHRLPPAIAETLVAGGRRQFHWRSPAPPAFTGSTSIHRLHRIVMGRYIDNSSGVKMVYLQLPIYTEVQIYLSIYPVTIPRKRHCGEPPGTCHGNLLYFLFGQW